MDEGDEIQVDRLGLQGIKDEGIRTQSKMTFVLLDGDLWCHSAPKCERLLEDIPPPFV